MDVEGLRLLVYRSFADTGRAPEVVAAAAELGVETSAVRAGFLELARARHLALDAAGAILMAHPFSAIPLGFAVMGRSTLWWGGCAWDSFALPHLVPGEKSVLVSTRCPGCDRALAWNVGNHRPPEGDEVAHFLLPAARMWDDVVRTCANQRLFCGESCVDSWLAATGQDRGYVMDLATLWRLASGWYAGRLERGYTRREPSAAADYLRAVGLSGQFWGL